MTHTFIHEDVLQVMKSFRYDAHVKPILFFFSNNYKNNYK